MEYGECIVLGAKNEILMIDCGSMNLKIRENQLDFKEYVKLGISDRYRDIANREFLLTHFHLDHISGFRHIIREDPFYFHRIFLPFPSVDYLGRPILLEIAFYVFAFLSRQCTYSQVSIGALSIFSFLEDSMMENRVSLLRRGDQFEFSDILFDVLWPPDQGYHFSEVLCQQLEEMDRQVLNLGGEFYQVFLLKNQFCEEYLYCCHAIALSGSIAPEVQKSIQKQKDILEKIRKMNIIDHLGSYEYPIYNLLSNLEARRAYSDSLNALSLVFHHNRVQTGKNESMLLTGDATPKTFEAIFPDLSSHYFLFKAPHHGTESSWSDCFTGISKSHILISNGEYVSGGLISDHYVNDSAVKHCTNTSRCAWARSRKECCNTLSLCSEFSNCANFAFRCPKNRSKEGKAACSIYRVSLWDDQGCFCC